VSERKDTEQVCEKGHRVRPERGRRHRACLRGRTPRVPERGVPRVPETERILREKRHQACRREGSEWPRVEDHEAAPLTEEPLNMELGVQEMEDIFEHDD